MTGHQHLRCLGLDGAPPTELVEGTLATWVSALWEGRSWIQQRDTPRIRAAFRALARTAGRWPTPRDFLAAMPSTAPAAIALPSPERLAKRERSVIAGGDALRKLGEQMGWLGGDSDEAA